MKHLPERSNPFEDSEQLDVDEDLAPQAPWSLRSRELDAEAFDSGAGMELFMQGWGKDIYFSALDPAALSGLPKYLQFVRIPADKEIVRQNECGDFMVVVLEGEVLVDRVQPSGARVRLAAAHAGDMLGEMSLLDAGVRSSSCRTLTACTLAVVEKDRLNAMARSEPAMALALMASLSRRLSLRLRKVSSRLSALLAGN